MKYNLLFGACQIPHLAADERRITLGISTDCTVRGVNLPGVHVIQRTDLLSPAYRALYCHESGGVNGGYGEPGVG